MSTASSTRQTALDLLRLISALMVVIYHFGFRMEISGEGGGIAFPEIASVAIWGEAGLLVFFAISGYVIAMSAEGRSAYDFMAGRIARLWPAMVVCATITAIVVTTWSVPGIAPPTLKQWLAQGAIVSRVLGQPFMDGAYWTIAYEITFYVWVAMLMAFGVFNTSWRTILTVWIAISIANESILHNEIIRKIFITEFSGYFVFGVALYKSQREQDRGTLALLLLAVFWTVLSRYIVEQKFFATYGVHRSQLGVGLMGPASLALVALAVRLRDVPIPATLAMGLGALTYPLYLLHQHIGYAVFNNVATPATRWLIAALLIATLLGVSHLVARYAEAPGRRLVLGIAGWVKRQACASSALLPRRPGPDSSKRTVRIQ